MKVPVDIDKLRAAKQKDNIDYQTLIFKWQVFLQKERDKDREKWKKEYMEDYRKERKKKSLKKKH